MGRGNWPVAFDTHPPPRLQHGQGCSVLCLAQSYHISHMSFFIRHCIVLLCSPSGWELSCSCCMGVSWNAPECWPIAVLGITLLLLHLSGWNSQMRRSNERFWQWTSRRTSQKTCWSRWAVCLVILHSCFMLRPHCARLSGPDHGFKKSVKATDCLTTACWKNTQEGWSSRKAVCL